MSADESKLQFQVASSELFMRMQQAKYDDLLKKHTQLAQAFQEMYTTLRKSGSGHPARDAEQLRPHAARIVG